MRFQPNGIVLQNGTIRKITFKSNKLLIISVVIHKHVYLDNYETITVYRRISYVLNHIIIYIISRVLVLFGISTFIETWLRVNYSPFCFPENQYIFRSILQGKSGLWTLPVCFLVNPSFRFYLTTVPSSQNHLEVKISFKGQLLCFDKGT